MLADMLMAAYARRGLRASLLLRGSAGFGVKHHVRTDRLLTLSEDLPLVSMAVDGPGPIMAAAEEALALSGDGLITLERASLGAAPPGRDEVKLTVHLGRGARAAGRPAHVALAELLHANGVAGASVLLGVDGTAHGRRRRARFAGANGHVPLIVVSVGDAGADRRRPAPARRAARGARAHARARARVQARRRTPRRAARSCPRAPGCGASSR